MEGERKGGREAKGLEDIKTLSVKLFLRLLSFSEAISSSPSLSLSQAIDSSLLFLLFLKQFLHLPFLSSYFFLSFLSPSLHVNTQ